MKKEKIDMGEGLQEFFVRVQAPYCDKECFVLLKINQDKDSKKVISLIASATTMSSLRFTTEQSDRSYMG